MRECIEDFRLQLETLQMDSHHFQEHRHRLAHMPKREVDEGMPDAPHRVQDVHRTLHDAGQMLPADVGERLSIDIRHADAAAMKIESDRTAHHFERRQRGGGDGPDQRRLAATRFTGETVDLVGPDLKAHAVDRPDFALNAECGRLIVRAQIGDGQHRIGHAAARLSRLRGSMYSFIDTASRNRAMKVMTTRSTGKKIHHQIPATMAVCWLAQ